MPKLPVILIKKFQSFFFPDLTLEYEDGDKYEEFVQFYEDVLPEFKAVGRVTQFVVCCNYEPHLRGNVYIQYARYDIPSSLSIVRDVTRK